MELTTLVIAALVLLVVLLGCVFLLLDRVRSMERDLAAETKERRELGYQVQQSEWKTNEALALLGLKREQSKPAQWVRG